MKKRELLERIEALEKENAKLWARLEALEPRLPTIQPWYPHVPYWPLSPVIRYSDNTAMIEGQDVRTDGQFISIL